jgi:hypothetical protein
VLIAITGTAVLIFGGFLVHCVAFGWRTRIRQVGSVRMPATSSLARFDRYSVGLVERHPIEQ